jgi:ethanolamine utilization protein EutA
VYRGEIRPQAVFFSGGVADCIFNPQSVTFPYGDIGNLLGASIRRGRLFREASVCHSAETLRATVIGAGVHLITVSGSTISFSPGILPLKNIPVLKLSETEYENLIEGNLPAVTEKTGWFLNAAGSENIALAFRGKRAFVYNEIERLAEALAQMYGDPKLTRLIPILLIEHDMAKSLGQALKRKFGASRELICVDGVAAGEGDYVDLGAPIMNDVVIPVAVKTLIMQK